MGLGIVIDHLVLVSDDVERALAFYRDVLGAEVRGEAEWRAGPAKYPVLQFGAWKVNVHPRDTLASPRARAPVPGSLDLCLVWPGTVETALRHLASHGVAVEMGPVAREGAAGGAASTSATPTATCWS